jgi:hypothetical protein
MSPRKVRANEVPPAMAAPLTATLEPSTRKGPPDELAVTMRIVNASDATVEVLNPDMGRPSAQMNWPWSIQMYRASLLMSYGYLAVSVFDESGQQVDREPVETWATPVLHPRLALSPGDSFNVPIPVARFFRLSRGRRYRMSVEYGDEALKIHAEGTVDVPGH